MFRHLTRQVSSNVVPPVNLELPFFEALNMAVGRTFRSSRHSLEPQKDELPFKYKSLGIALVKILSIDSYT